MPTALLLLFACADPAPRAAPEGQPPAVAPGQASDTETADGGTMDSAAVAAARAEDDAAEAAAARTYRERQAAMGTREDCLRQAAGLPPQQRQRIEEACSRLRPAARPR
jgi:hypothetical protein